MSEGITIDLGSVLPYLAETVLGMFHCDSDSAEWKLTVHRLIQLSAEQSSFVQCIGMSRPVPIDRIYQPTTLIFPARASQTLDVGRFLLARDNLVILAGPGQGKSTLLHWLYLQFCRDRAKTTVPVLFTLRLPSARLQLQEFVDRLIHTQKQGFPKRSRLILLVDGYDEISKEDRILVSESLTKFKTLDIGNFYLTCRSFYDVYNLTAEECRIASFTRRDSLAFIKAFGEIYSVDMDPDSTVRELEAHGFSSFVEHPLMLTLVCILKSSSNPHIPRRAIGLVRRAIDTLTWRWDEQKGIRREAEVPLDGEERVRCLMRVAFGMSKLEETAYNVEGLVRDYLSVVQLKNIDVRKLLNEIARWYGILVPTTNDNWSFVHRTIHDYLAARYWVESNAFRPDSVRHWDTRAGYALCLIPDATQHFCRMLETNELGVFTECLYNQPSFKATQVAIAVLHRTERNEQFKIDYGHQSIKVHVGQDWFSLAGDELLQEIAINGLERAALGGQAAAFYALAELGKRKVKFESANLRRILDSGNRAKSGYFVEVERGDGKTYSFSPLEVVLPQSC
jgi:hypothetical protein